MNDKFKVVDRTGNLLKNFLEEDVNDINSMINLKREVEGYLYD